MEPSIVHGPCIPSLLVSTVGELLRTRAAKNGNDVALISQHQNEIYTYADLHRRSDDLAAGLLALGVGKGDRVAVMLGSRSEYIDIFFACAKMGAFLTLLNYAYTSAEFKGALKSTKPCVLITTLVSGRYDYQESLSSLTEEVPSVKAIVLLHDTAAGYKFSAGPPQFRDYHEITAMGSRQHIDWAAIESTISATDILNLQFTSGSSGAPKAAALTHLGMINSGRYIAHQMHVESKDRLVVPLPLFHAFGLVIGFCMSFVAGASVVLPSEYFDAGESLKAVENYKCTGLYGVTTMFIAEMSHPNFAKTKRSTLRFGVMAGSAMPEELVKKVMASFSIPDLHTNWGMTECTSIVTMTHVSDPLRKRMTTAGRLLPNFIGKIVEPNTDRVLPWGSRGEIVISGFGVMHSYYEDEVRTANAMLKHPQDLIPGHLGADHDGNLRTWLHTGDEGYLDPDGYFVITGRIKDLIIRGGENIAPLEIEERLFAHPAIKQASVFGLSDERLGEEVAAFLELDDNILQRPSDEDIQKWIRQTLSRFKAPTKIWWLGDASRGVPEQWPTTANGKLRKKDIKEIAEELVKRNMAVDMSPIRASL